MKIYSFIFLFLISMPLWGQSNENMIENIRQLSASQEITIAQSLSDPSVKYISGRMAKGDASISSNYSEADNFSSITQNGNNNISKVEQTGASDYYELSQNGNYNESSVVQNGSGLSTSVNQYGDNNILRQNMAGDGQNYSFTQNGNGNELIQSGDRLSRLNGLEVIQRGDNMKLIINNSSFYK